MASYGDRIKHAQSSSDRELPFATKLKVVKLMGEGLSNKQIAQKLLIPIRSVNSTVGNKTEMTRLKNLLDVRSTRGVGKYPDVDKSMADWFCMARKHGTTVTIGNVKKKAKKFAKLLGYQNFHASNNWLRSWRKKYSIVNQKHKYTYYSKNLPRPLANIQEYTAENVYAVAEIPMLHKSLPFVTEDKTANEKLTVMLACNAIGSDKLQTLVVGSKHLSDQSNLPCEYFTDRNSWMTPDIFVNWLMRLDDEMIKQGRKIFLIVESSPVHPVEVENDLSNIKILFVEPHSNPSKHPFATGISRYFKACYRREYYQKHLLGTDVDVFDLDLLHLLNQVWLNICSDKISSCFWNAGYKFGSPPRDQFLEVKIERLSSENFDRYVNIDSDLRCWGVRSDEELCEKAVFEHTQNEKVFKKTPSLRPETQYKLTSAERDALESLAVIRRYYETNEMTDFSSYYALETQVMDHICNQKHDDK